MLISYARVQLLAVSHTGFAIMSCYISNFCVSLVYLQDAFKLLNLLRLSEVIACNDIGCSESD